MAEVDRLRSELHEARQALKAMRASPDQLRAEIDALEKIISERFSPFPLPSEELRLHVGAKTTASNFLNQGWASSRKVLSLFGENPSAPILDWGCGTGRTLRWLLAFPAWKSSYRGTDVDAAAISWLESYGIKNVRVCSDSLPYADGELGGVFSFSVLTHIHPSKFRRWFVEIARVLYPGSTAYLTFNGDSIVESAEPQHAEAAAEFKRRGWAWIDNAGHYKSASFVEHSFVAEAARGLFNIGRIARRDYGPMDALLAEKL